MNGIYPDYVGPTTQYRLNSLFPDWVRGIIDVLPTLPEGWLGGVIVLDNPYSVREVPSPVSAIVGAAINGVRTLMLDPYAVTRTFGLMTALVQRTKHAVMGVLGRVGVVTTEETGAKVRDEDSKV